MMTTDDIIRGQNTVQFTRHLTISSAYLMPVWPQVVGSTCDRQKQRTAEALVHLQSEKRKEDSLNGLPSDHVKGPLFTTSAL